MKTNNKATEAAQRLQEMLEKIDALENGELNLNAAELSDLSFDIRDATHDIAEYLFMHLRHFQPLFNNHLEPVPS